MRILLAAALVAVALGGAGCVERTLQIRSNPSGARVFLDDREVGKTPMMMRFDFYGHRAIRLVKDGYVSHRGEVDLAAPWYEWFPLDFFAEILIPFTIRDRHRYVAALEPQPTGKAAEAAEEALLERAELARMDARKRWFREQLKAWADTPEGKARSAERVRDVGLALGELDSVAAPDALAGWELTHAELIEGAGLGDR